MSDITLYFWPTPNCYKISIMLEELEQDYKVEPVHIGKGAQFAPDYLQKSPNAKVPVLEDRSDIKKKYIFESGAILFYLAEKHNKFLGEKTADKIEVMQWLMFQMGNLGPLLGQAHHFRFYAKEKLIMLSSVTRERLQNYTLFLTNSYLKINIYPVMLTASRTWQFIRG